MSITSDRAAIRKTRRQRNNIPNPRRVETILLLRGRSRENA